MSSCVETVEEQQIVYYNNFSGVDLAGFENGRLFVWRGDTIAGYYNNEGQGWEGTPAALGTGYPAGLAGTDIPIEARVVTVANNRATHNKPLTMDTNSRGHSSPRA